MMATNLTEDSIVVLCKGGRLPVHGDLTEATRLAHRREHVDRMLEVAREHRLIHLEGFRLITAQQPWTHFWVMEFRTLGAAEAWIGAEMAPPSGAFGYYEYQLARRHGLEVLADWAPNPRPESTVPFDADPHDIPPLDVARSSVVVLLWGRRLPEGRIATPEERGDDEHNALMRSVAREHGMIRIEAFQSLSPQLDWHRAWVIEFPTFAGAEAWLDAEVLPPHGRYSQKRYHLARRWAPDYFAQWPAWAAGS